MDRSGWTEASGGNISLDISTAAGELVPGSGAWYLVSTTGSRMREIATDPWPSILLVNQQRAGERFYPADRKPSREWNCHHLLLGHLREQGREELALLHAHPNSLIVLSHLPGLSEAQLLNDALSDSLPEFTLFLPRGVALVPYAPPGSAELARTSAEAIAGRDALIWARHGFICAGIDLASALDRIQVAEKAARILLDRMLLPMNAVFTFPNGTKGGV